MKISDEELQLRINQDDAYIESWKSSWKSWLEERMALRALLDSSAFDHCEICGSVATRYSLDESYCDEHDNGERAAQFKISDLSYAPALRKLLEKIQA